jgi:Tol biopolymer transport system component
VQFAILPPEGMQFARTLQVAVSPDERFVIFAMGSGTTPGLWLRPIDSLTARPLTGTEGATLPFWSPDSRAVGFFNSGKLQTIRIDGGPASVICNVATGRGATWNRDNVIVFSPAADAPLQRVSATGGTPSPVTTLDPPRENSHRMPSFLPDGRHFLFLAGGQAAAGGIAWQVKVGSIDGPETVKVADADLGSSPVYSAGHLLFTRNRTLMAVRFDPDTHQTSGAPFAVTDQPFSTNTASAAAFSVSPGGLLAFMPAADRTARLAWIGRDGKTIGNLGDSAVFFGAALAPDEERVAITIETGPLRDRDVWIVNRAQGTRAKFTLDPANEGSPVWSPDGTVVYFNSTRNGSSNIFRKSADGTGSEELVIPSDRSQYPTDISRDGTVLIFTQVTASGTEVWALPLSGEQKPWPVAQGPSAKGQGTLSPDARWLAYESNESGRAEIYVVPFPSGGAPQRVSSAGGAEPRWRADGKELFFIAGGSLVAVPITTGNRFVAGAAQPLFPSRTDLGNLGGGAQSFAPSRDGQQFLTTIVEGPPPRNPLTVVTNWLTTVR